MPLCWHSVGCDSMTVVCDSPSAVYQLCRQASCQPAGAQLHPYPSLHLGPTLACGQFYIHIYIHTHIHHHHSIWCTLAGTCQGWIFTAETPNCWSAGYLYTPPYLSRMRGQNWKCTLYSINTHAARPRYLHSHPIRQIMRARRVFSHHAVNPQTRHFRRGS